MPLEIIDLSHHKKDDKTYSKNFLAPQIVFRMLISGASGGGKTNMMMNLILHHLRFDKLYLYSRHLYDPKDVYISCISLFEKAQKRVQKRLKDPNYKIIEYSDKFEDIPTYDQYDNKLVNLVVIDDFVNEPNQKKIVEYYTSGRHSNISIFYLSQSMYLVDKTIRLNCNYIAIFETPSARELRMLASEFCAEKTYEEIVEMMKEALNEPFSFFLIDKKSTDKNLRYRKRFEELLITHDSDSDKEEENN
jgi:hypothetical protein